MLYAVTLLPLLLLTPPLQKGRLVVFHDGGSEVAASVAAAGGGRQVTHHGYRACNWQGRNSRLRILDTGLPVSQTYIGTAGARKP